MYISLSMLVNAMVIFALGLFLSAGAFIIRAILRAPYLIHTRVAGHY